MKHPKSVLRDIVASRPAIELNDRVHDQCAFEYRLAERLRSADRSERMRLYGEVYNEYSEKFPESLPKDSSKAERIARNESLFLRRFVTPATVVAEIGPGRCHLAFSLAPVVRKIYGVDVNAVEAVANANPANFEFRLTDGIAMPFDSDSIDLVISNQLMEHLHPDDATEQLREVYRVLRVGGHYVCITPSPVNGPHDCSAYFDDLPCPIKAGHYSATGLHLKEYTARELLAAFRNVGFKRTQTFVGARGNYITVPPSIITLTESALRLVPPDRRKRSRLLSVILDHRVCATK
jgi:SAM-dependent methyltransferase